MTQIGDEFVERHIGSGYGRKVKVAKIYKNGNIVFEGSTQQYRLMGDTTVSTSGSHYSRMTFVRVTPDRVEKIKESQKLQRAKERLRDLSDILAAASRSNDPDKVLPLAELFKDIRL